jgi:hypothetical protein
MLIPETHRILWIAQELFLHHGFSGTHDHRKPTVATFCGAMEMALP